jgi:hypothetical protein
LRVKGPQREADHSPPYNDEIKNQWSYTSTFSICLHGMHGDTFAVKIITLVRRICDGRSVIRTVSWYGWYTITATCFGNIEPSWSQIPGATGSGQVSVFVLSIPLCCLVAVYRRTQHFKYCYEHTTSATCFGLHCSHL